MGAAARQNANRSSVSHTLSLYEQLRSNSGLIADNSQDIHTPNRVINSNSNKVILSSSSLNDKFRNHTLQHLVIMITACYSSIKLRMAQIYHSMF